jgi:hypothetical protein
VITKTAAANPVNGTPRIRGHAIPATPVLDKFRPPRSVGGRNLPGRKKGCAAVCRRFSAHGITWAGELSKSAFAQPLFRLESF